MVLPACNLIKAQDVARSMKRPGGIVPPGKAGLLMLAAALVPIVLKEAKPLVRAAGRGLRHLGDAIMRIADSSQIGAEPAEAQTVAEEVTDEPSNDKAKRGKKPSKKAAKK